MTVTKPTLTFCGGTGSVTGANFLLTTPQKKILVDCGMIQGRKMCDDANTVAFMYNPADIDALIVTHAHLDHIGRIPKLVKDGFKGAIYSTKETKELAEVMLPDAARVVGEEAQRCGMAPAYTENDIPAVFKNWEVIPYYQSWAIGDATFYLKDAGHVLGSAFVECTHDAFGKLVFSGDLGNSPSPLLRDTDVVNDANYMIIESVYGDRNHEVIRDRRAVLEDIIENVITRHGTLLIPAFSIERTQTILFDINVLVEERRIPRIPVFLDAPLAIKVTDIYKRSTDLFNKQAQEVIRGGDDIFSFEGLKVIATPEGSKAIHATDGAKIIIAGSGMSHGGRIIHHEKHYLSDASSTLLIVGYQSPGSLGRELQEGVGAVTIEGEKISVRARIETLRAYSGHRDLSGLLEFASASNLTLKKVFVAMGEPSSSQFLTQRLRDFLGLNAAMPAPGETVELG
ncbi:MAG: MBL fold metallo-hydrolase [Patescibacteria group bacterium]